HRDSFCAICLCLMSSGLTPFSVAELLHPAHTAESLISNEPGHFEADPFNIAPTLCQRIDSPIQQAGKLHSLRLERAIQDMSV
ncbi:MAG: hypothetical protein ABL935_04870, partial [Nitrospiraceae bacterium]